MTIIKSDDDKIVVWNDAADSYPKSVVDYYPNYLQKLPNIYSGYADTCYATLMCIDWERRPDAPRYEYWSNDFDRPYTYGRGAGERTYQSKKMPVPVDCIRGFFLLTHGVYLEGCFLNRYDDGRDSLGWHADDDPGIDHSKPIMVITLGQKRLIKVKHKENNSLKHEIMLEHGSLLVMRPGMQTDWLHSIPKAGFEAGPRISLTYRGLING